MVSSLQIADTGTKMIHIGSDSKSFIVAKSISINNSQNIYRNLIECSYNSFNSYNYSQCDSLILGNKSLTVTLPYLKNFNYSSTIQLEAFISNIQMEQLF
eukprot:GHVU01059717.1.p1 GENE.GHVU01059717.1~~GHVU01059717.1.p1  ORF type:complete len:100 (+),score=0.86 GHVU01059717.1:1208-1507(+)